MLAEDEIKTVKKVIKRNTKSIIDKIIKLIRQIKLVNEYFGYDFLKHIYFYMHIDIQNMYSGT